jgi:hypothetical protein
LACRHTNKVTALEVEAVQLVASLLCIHDVFIDDEGSSLGVAGNALADLTVRALVLCFGAKGNDIEGLTYRIGPYLPKSSKSSSGVTL